MAAPPIHTLSRDQAFQALEALKQGKNPTELFQGCLMAFNSEIWVVRRKAAEVLRGLGASPAVVDALKKAYPQGSLDQRFWVMKVLAQLMGTEILPWIRKTYAQTTDPNLRVHAISAAAEVEGPEASEFLVEALRDDSWLNRYAAATNIRRRGPEVLKLLQKGFSEGSGDLKYWCLRLIVQIMGPESKPTIIKGQQSEDANIRHYVLRSMETIDADWVIPILVNYLGDPNWSNRRVAADILRSRGRRSLRELAKACESPRQDVRYWAVRTLGETGDERAVKTLEQFLYTCEHEDEGIWAIRALSRVSCAASARAILEATYEIPGKTEIIEEALIQLGATSIRPLLEYIDSPSESIAKVCRQTLPQLPFPCMEALSQSLLAITPEEREGLIKDFKVIGQDELLELLNRPNLSLEDIRKTAERAPPRAFPTMSTISVMLDVNDPKLKPEPAKSPPQKAPPNPSISEEVIVPDSLQELARQVTSPQPSRAPAGPGPVAYAPSSMSVELPPLDPTARYPIPLEEILAKATKLGASDIHLKPGLPPIFRIHGSLRRTDMPALDAEGGRHFVFEVLPVKAFRDFELELEEADVAYSHPDLGRFRVNCYHESQGPGLALRHIPNKIPTLAEIGLPRVFRELCKQKQGLILITGPTGSGKSTTLAALIDFINSNREEHIITIEDPIEFMHENRASIVTARELGSHTKSFAHALRASLREDPDILLVGEMRDLETMQLALTAAETGHLVFSTLHTTSAAETVDRIINVFPAENQELIRISLAESLTAIVTQLLVPTSDGKRTPVRDILIRNSGVANMIREGKLHQVDQVIVTGRKEGMQTRDHDLQRLLKEKKVTLETAYAYCLNRDSLRN